MALTPVPASAPCLLLAIAADSDLPAAASLPPQATAVRASGLVALCLPASATVPQFADALHALAATCHCLTARFGDLHPDADSVTRVLHLRRDALLADLSATRSLREWTLHLRAPVFTTSTPETPAPATTPASTSGLAFLAARRAAHAAVDGLPPHLPAQVRTRLAPLLALAHAHTLRPPTPRLPHATLALLAPAHAEADLHEAAAWIAAHNPDLRPLTLTGPWPATPALAASAAAPIPAPQVALAG
jgi:hypothetical protein